MGAGELLGSDLQMDSLASCPRGVEILLAPLHATKTGISCRSYEPFGSFLL